MLVNCVVRGLSSGIDSAEVGTVDADEADEADADADGDAADLDAISAIVEA